jgi:hypothetical protein
VNLKIFTSLICCSFLLACTTPMYQGPTKASSEVATLELSCALVESIDGVKTQYNGGGYGKFQVLPGSHRLSVTIAEVCGYRSLASLDISFDAEAGHEYIVSSKTANLRWTPEIIDKKSRKNVGYFNK